MVIAPNEPGIAVIEERGFDRGHYRSGIYDEGEHVDSYRYDILASNWQTEE